MRYHGKARVNPRSPQAFAICDRCGGLLNHVDLKWQHDWAGAAMVNKRLLVCRTCTDRPQQQLRSIILPPDPVPISNPRRENYAIYETDYRSTQDGDVRITEGGDDRVVQEEGE